MARGDQALKAKDFDRAIAEYTEVLRLSPAHARAYNNRGYSYYKKNNLDLALADYDEAIRRDPKLRGPTAIAAW